MGTPAAAKPTKAKKPRKARTPRGSSAKMRHSVQFDVSPEDDADLDALVGDEMKNRTTVARRLFLYGLDNSEAAFAAYAKSHQEARRKRIAAAEGAEPNASTQSHSEDLPASS